MGKRIPIVSFLCGIFTGRRRTPPPSPTKEAEKREDSSDSSTTRSRDEDATNSPAEQLPQPLPPPPGAGPPHHMRTVSCQHTRSNSGVSKLVSSLSLRAMGGGGGGWAGREEKGKSKEKKFKHEDSIWKKTIILGEKCRVPDEDEDHILYDEKGNKISTYHPKTHSGVLTFSTQTSNIDQDQLFKK